MASPFAVTPASSRRIRVTTGIGLATLAALVLLARLPGTVSSLNSTAKQNNGYTPIGRTLAAADSFDIDNGFVVAALNDIPQRTTFAIVTPAVAPAGVSPETLGALSPYLQYLLLPSRLAPADSAAYLLCYHCDRGPFGKRVHWIWADGKGLFIGRARAHA